MSSSYAIKMRAAKGERHISGAERIVAASDAPAAAAALVKRALDHALDTPDFINVKLEAARKVKELEALKVTTHRVATPEAGWAVMAEVLGSIGITDMRRIKALFEATYQMRGAMLLDADTFERLEPDCKRGIRATYMDGDYPERNSPVKHHFEEALVLATKVANAPGIVAEICVSDDPGYITGYVATRQRGYERITVLKKLGSPLGGRIFFYRGSRDKIAKTIEFLEKTPVIVRGVGRKALFPAESLRLELAEIKAAGLYREAHPADPKLAVFAANDYLGLAPAIGGSTGSRLTTGTTRYHEALENLLARFKHREAALLFATGYMANVGTISALVGKEDAVFSDALNHASIIDGCRLSGAKTVVYGHLDYDGLERLLAATSARRKLVVSDGVFSMDGDILDLPRFLAICRRHNALAMVDEAHANGVLGKTGRGLAEYFGSESPDIEIGTLSKAFGSEGGFVACSRLVREYLVNKARPFIFSTAPSVKSVKSSIKAVKAVMAHPELVARLHRNLRLLGDHPTPIVPVVVGDEKRALRLAEELAAEGFLASAIRYPTVPKGKARLRIAVSAAHTPAQLRRLKALLETIARQ